MLDTKERLARGKFDHWVDDHLSFSRSTAYRYMAVAQIVSLMRRFFPLGRTIVYELMGLPEEELKKLTLDSVINGKRLGDITCCEGQKAFSPEKEESPMSQSHD